MTGISSIAIVFQKEDDIKAAYSKMSEELGIHAEPQFNWVYDPEMILGMKYETLIYKAVIAAVLICGFLVLFDIEKISVLTDIELYEKIKAMGVKPWQVKALLLRQMHVISAIGILPGLCIGYFGGSVLAPLLLNNSSSKVMIYADTADFLTAAVLTYLLVMLASAKPAQTAYKVNPSDLRNEENNYNFNRKKSRRRSKMKALHQMCLLSIGRCKKGSVITITLLSAGLSALSCMHVINSSFDIEKYMKSAAISDFMITVSEELTGTIDKIEEITEKGYLYSQDVPVQLSENAFQNITSYYEQNNGEILEYMKQDPLWTEGYQKMKAAKSCMVSVFGMDGLVSEKVLSSNILKGSIDKEKFALGGYAIAYGYDGENGKDRNQPTYSVGESVMIDGRKFEIMAIAEPPYVVTEGSVNPGAEFNLTFFLPNSQFREMYPENTPQKLFFNVDPEYLENAEAYMEEQFVNRGIPVTSKKR